MHLVHTLASGNQDYGDNVLWSPARVIYLRNYTGTAHCVTWAPSGGNWKGRDNLLSFLVGLHALVGLQV